MTGLELILELEFIKKALLFFVFFILLFFELSLMYSIFKNRKEVKLVTAILRKDGNTISKGGVAFFILMVVIVYQSLFMQAITDGLVELLGFIIAGDVGGKAVEAYKETKIGKKMNLPSDLNEEEKEK